MAILPLMNRIAVIDCGTNTFNLLIVDISKDGWHKVFSSKIAVKLGKGGIQQGVIRPERLARGLDALIAHKHTMMNYGVTDALVLATSAMREAENAPIFIRQARELCGFEVRVIDGVREAQLIFKGVEQTIHLDKERVTIVDIGGGSTEFIIASAEGIHFTLSLPIGVARLYETIEPSDPMTSEETQRMYHYLDELLKPLADALQRFPSTIMIGSSGSFDTLLDMHVASEGTAHHEGLSQEIPLKAFRVIHDKIVNSNREKRLMLPGMIPLRVDYMPLASTLTNYLLDRYHFESMIRSAYALKEGAVAELNATSFGVE